MVELCRKYMYRTDIRCRQLHLLAIRTISKALYDQIPDTDWRKITWIAPEDAGKEPGNKYRTILSDVNFKKLPAYTNLKFKPKEGNMIDANIGATIDYLMMRVEEMYFIEPKH